MVLSAASLFQLSPTAILGSRGLFDHKKELTLVGGVHHDCWTGQRKRKHWWILGLESAVVSTGLAGIRPKEPV